MADIFGDLGLFVEFEKDRPASDEILKQNIDVESRDISLNNDEMRIRNDSVVTKGDTLHCASDEGSGDKYSLSKRNNSGDISNSNYVKKMESEIARLTTLNANLMRQNRLINLDRYSKSKNGPMLQVLFMNHAVSRRYRTEIEAFITSLIDKDVTRASSRSSQLPALLGRPNFVPLGSSDVNDVNEPCDRYADDFTVIGVGQYYNSFAVDPVGWPLIDYNPSLSDGWQIPKYEQVFLEPLPCEDEVEVPSMVFKQTRQKKTCFNCGGEHNLIDCKEKHNAQRISENRRQFRQKFPQQSPVQSRYHMEEDPRFAVLKPGSISDSLREALGIAPNQLPPYIYQMRFLGYPPGHLENARHQTSGLSMFGKHGLELNADGEILEDGEVNEDNKPKVVYDINKVVDYPGFNVSPAPGTVDEWEKFKMLPMQPKDSKDAMRERFNFQGVATTKRSIGGAPDENAVYKKIAKREATEDMELDESVSLSDSIQEGFIVIDDVSAEASGASTPVPATPERSLEDGQPGADRDSADSSALKTPLGYCASVSFTLGTPIDADKSDDPELANLPKALPDRTNFAVGVSDHILYENLPNATGTYKRLRKIIQSIHKHSSSPSDLTPEKR